MLAVTFRGTREDVGKVYHAKATRQIEIIPSFMVISSKLPPETGVSWSPFLVDLRSLNVLERHIISKK